VQIRNVDPFILIGTNRRPKENFQPLTKSLRNNLTQTGGTPVNHYQQYMNTRRTHSPKNPPRIMPQDAAGCFPELPVRMTGVHCRPGVFIVVDDFSGLDISPEHRAALHGLVEVL
jgi:hypothetical protein